VRRVWLAVILVASPFVAAADAPATQVHYVMGTYLRITADGDRAASAMTACFQDARRLDGVFSRWSETSELSHLNAAAPGTRIVSPDMAALLTRSLVLARATDGAFDVRAGPLTAVWRRDVPPSEADLLAARAAASADAIRIRGARVALAAGARLDFDGIAKGWAVDACVARLRAAGVTSALISLGESSLFALGAPAGAPRWELAVRGPDPETTVGWLGLRDAGASVSATYGSDGKRAGRVAHVLDPRTGRPLTDDAVAVAVAPSATDAEAWTKALLVWGADGVARVRAAGATAAIHIAAAAIRADVAGPAVSWEPLPAPHVISAREEPLR
jgi:thiamine biosynthesis lipoprotein